MKFLIKRAVARQLNALKERTAFKPSKVNSLLVIHEIDLDITEAQYTDMLAFFATEYKSVARVHYSPNKKFLEGLPPPHLHAQSLDWRGRMQADDLRYVLEQEYDLVLHFVSQITFPLTYFSAKLKAKFRIGPASMDECLNDLVLPSSLDFGTYMVDFKNFYKKIKPNDRI
jgi:hypothetical protein